MRQLPLVIAFLLAGCRPADQSTPAGSGGGSAGSAAIESVTFAPALNVDLKASTKTASGLYYRDLTVGGGPEVANGQQVSVHYSGWLIDGTLFDQSVAGQPPLTFSPGAGGVIPGWEEGALGMRLGGKRQLILPPGLGYGAAGNGPIPPNAILVFTVEVVGIR
ncbi:MAG: FKBP-type peptidyl-prolyl cis-trans isomerase [Gemmatimonadales bacterium]